MKKFRWNHDKNMLLKKMRGICFDDLMRGRYIKTLPHPNTEKYPHQYIMIYLIDDYPYCIPYVEEDDHTLFLKTIYPNRNHK